MLIDSLTPSEREVLLNEHPEWLEVTPKDVAKYMINRPKNTPVPDDSEQIHLEIITQRIERHLRREQHTKQQDAVIQLPPMKMGARTSMGGGETGKRQ